MPTTAFIHRGVSKVWWLLGVVNPLAPTRAEINAGVDLTSSIQAVSGFALQNQTREFAPVGASFVETRRGVDKITGPCTLTMYDSKASTTIRNTWMIAGFAGIVLFAPYGDIAGRRCEVWTCRIATVADTWTDGPAVYRVVFAPLGRPAVFGVMPA